MESPADRRRETRHRNENQTKNRKYQRMRMNWNIGTATNTDQYPAGVSRACHRLSGIAYQLEVVSAILLAQTQKPSV